MQHRRYVVAGDFHRPFHDKRLVKLTLEIWQDILCPTDMIILNGDILDMYRLSAHGPACPDVQENLEHEFQDGYEFVYDLRKRFPDNEILFIFGNHENRLDRFVMANAPGFWNILTTEKMLQLDRFNVDYLPYNSAWNVPNTNLFIQHSPPSYSVNGARTSLLKKFDQNYIWNCSHRVDMAVITAGSGTEYEAYFNGCLVDIKSKVFSYAKGHQSWQHSWSIVDVIGNEFFVNQVRFKNYSTYINGIYYEG